MQQHFFFALHFKFSTYFKHVFLYFIAIVFLQCSAILTLFCIQLSLSAKANFSLFFVFKIAHSFKIEIKQFYNSISWLSKIGIKQFSSILFLFYTNLLQLFFSMSCYFNPIFFLPEHYFKPILHPVISVSQGYFFPIFCFKIKGLKQ